MSQPTPPAAWENALPTSLIADFFRARSAMDALEGAPYLLRDVNHNAWMYAVRPESIPGDTRLHIGAEAVCPAAEGWVSRLLALTLGVASGHAAVGPRDRVSFHHGDKLIRQWIWRPAPQIERLFREETLVGEEPPTPAARLAAVLRYELERTACR